MPAGARRRTPDRGSGAMPAERYRLAEPGGAHAAIRRAVDAQGREYVVKSGPAPVIEHEYRILTGLAHPGIISAIDLIDTGLEPLLVLEALPGGDLVSLAGSAPRHWLPALAELVAAVGYLHAAGLVHRDIKARHVMFDAAGRVRLIDFGSALPTGSPWTTGGTTVTAVAADRGTGPVTPADDVHALAVLVHELVHGAPPGLERVRPGATPAPPELQALLTAALGPGRRDARPSLSGFATVIESLLGTGADTTLA